MKKLIEIFTKIRETPYQIIDIPYTLKNSYDLVKNNGASCTPKHIVLADKFQKLGFQVRFCVHEFSWADFKIDFNTKIKAKLQQCPLDFHTNLELKIKNDWIKVDATWDDKLLDIGLPGTRLWNGKDHTLNGVYSLAEYKFDSIEEREKFLISERKKIKYNPKDEFELMNELNTFFNFKR